MTATEPSTNRSREGCPYACQPCWNFIGREFMGADTSSGKRVRYIVACGGRPAGDLAPLVARNQAEAGTHAR
jgi:hypothetical protein